MAHFFVHSRMTFLFFIWLKTKKTKSSWLWETGPLRYLPGRPVVQPGSHPSHRLPCGGPQWWLLDSRVSEKYTPLTPLIHLSEIGWMLNFRPMQSLVRNSWPMVSWEWKSHSPWTRDSECLDQVQTVFQKPAISKLVCLMGVGPPFSWSGKNQKIDVLTRWIESVSSFFWPQQLSQFPHSAFQGAQLLHDLCTSGSPGMSGWLGSVSFSQSRRISWVTLFEVPQCLIRVPVRSNILCQSSVPKKLQQPIPAKHHVVSLWSFVMYPLVNKHRPWK